MKIWLLVIGIIFLLLGGVLAFVFFGPMGPKDINELEGDYDRDRNDFKNYDEGDTLILEGTITDEERNSQLKKNPLTYEFDNNEDSPVFSSEDLGDVGDKVCVKVTVREWEGDSSLINHPTLSQTSFEYLKVSKSYGFRFSNLGYIGLGVAGVGVVLLILGLALTSPEKKKETGAEPEREGPQEY